MQTNFLAFSSQLVLYLSARLVYSQSKVLDTSSSSGGGTGRGGGGGWGAMGALAPLIVKFRGLSPPTMYRGCLVPSRLNFFRLDGWVYMRLQ